MEIKLATTNKKVLNILLFIVVSNQGVVINEKSIKRNITKNAIRKKKC